MSDLPPTPKATSGDTSGPPRSTALCVSEGGSRRSACLAAVRHNPSFVAQLIATAADLPHTRQRRRATPGDALAAYSGVQAGWPVCDGRTRRIV